MLILRRDEVEDLLDPSELMRALEEGFKALSAGLLNVPSRIQIAAPRGVLLGMPAYMPGQQMSVKLVSIFHEHKPAHQALLTLFDSETGAPLALMDGEYITAIRTAACVMLSINLLARKNIQTVAIIGAGVQAKSHLEMIGILPGIEKIWIASRDPTHANSLARHDSRVRVADSTEQAVHGADVVCLCTSSSEPVIQTDWLKEGVHISSVGYRPPGGELPRGLIENSHLFVESKQAFETPPAGSAELQGLKSDVGTEIGEILLKRKPGRRSDQETTIYKSMGHAMEDLVAANVVYRKALGTKTGRQINL
jgi:alanine dehydrogenase